MQHDNEGGFPMNNNFNESNTDFILINPNDENRDDIKKTDRLGRSGRKNMLLGNGPSPQC